MHQEAAGAVRHVLNNGSHVVFGEIFEIPLLVIGPANVQWFVLGVGVVGRGKRFVLSDVGRIYVHIVVAERPIVVEIRYAVRIVTVLLEELASGIRQGGDVEFGITLLFVHFLR